MGGDCKCALVLAEAGEGLGGGGGELPRSLRLVPVEGKGIRATELAATADAGRMSVQCEGRISGAEQARVMGTTRPS